MNKLRTKLGAFVAALLLLLGGATAYATITTEQVYLLNKKFSPSVAAKVQLGTLIQNAETVVSADITNETILSEDILNGTIVADDIATGGVATAEILDDTVAVADLNTAVMVEATGTLSQANLLAIGTPIQLIAAPGAGKVIVVDEVELLHTYSTAQYATGADVQLEYETSGDNIALIYDTFFTAASSSSVIFKPSTYDLDGSTGTAAGFVVTANANKGIFVSGSNFTNGDASNIVKWRIRYHVVTLLT